MHTLKLAWLYFRLGAMGELQYRVNFFLQLLQSGIALAVGLVGLWLVFQHTQALGGWGPSELLAVLGVYTLVGGIVRTFIQPNMERIMDDVLEGTLDFALTKPVDAQILVSVREVRIWQAVDIVVGAAVLGVAVARLGLRVGWEQALAFAVALFLGATMLYAFWLLLTSISFWATRIHEMVNLFQGLFQAGRYPVDIYPGWLQGSLTILVPVAFAVTVPAQALTGRLTAQTLGLAALLALALVLMARAVWQRGLRNYGGASA